MKRRFRYRGFGLLIESELELPELPLVTAAADPEVVVRLGTVPRAQHRATMDHQVAFNAVGAAFLIREGREITVDPRPDADSAAVRIVLLGRVMGFLLRQRGWLPLHASGVGIGNECVLFLGEAGAGKSTAAAAFHRAGHPVITDDVGAVRVTPDGRCIVQSVGQFLRLKEDSRSALGEAASLTGFFQFDKYRCELSREALNDFYEVRCAYVVEYGERARTEPLSKMEATAMLSRHSFVRHQNMERESLERHLRDCAAVVGIVPVRRLVRRRSIGALPEVVRLVEDELASLALPG